MEIRTRLDRVSRILFSVLVVSAGLVLGVAGSASAGTLDQQQPTIGTLGYYLHSDQSLAQTFTAGISGALDQADLVLSHQESPDADLIVQIRDGSASGAGGQILASENVPPSSVAGDLADPQFVSIPFSPPAPVTAGQQYAIVAYTSTVFSNAYIWTVGTGNDPYPRGASFTQPDTPSPPSGSWTAGTGDFGFKTYVVPTPAAPTPPAQKKHCKKKKKHKSSAQIAKKKCKKKHHH